MPPPPSPLLLRAFLQRSLAAYFARPTSPVGAVPTPLPFPTYNNHLDYQAATRALYDQLSTAWLTPSELLQPHYGHAVAQWICNDWKVSGKSHLHIVEVGGGSGRLACDVLGWVQQQGRGEGAGVLYTSIEPSPVLAARQRSTNAQYGSTYTVLERDALHPDAFAGVVDGGGDGAHGIRDDAHTAAHKNAYNNNSPTPPHVVLLMSEVLDNLPHDRVVQTNHGWAATVVAEGLQEHLVHNVEDPLITTALEVYAKHTNDNEAHHEDHPPHTFSYLHRLRSWIHDTIAPMPPTNPIQWLPTGALQLFLNAQCHLPPSHSILAFDFDHLPDVCIAGAGAPIVADTHNGRTRDYNTYLLAPGTADIFWPTDFSRLCVLLNETVAPGAPEAHHCKASAFFAALPASEGCATRSGYNPLLQDFANTSVLVRGAQAALKPTLE